MYRHTPYSIQGLICAILAVLISGCAMVNPPLPTVPGFSQTPPSTPLPATSTLRPSAQPTPVFTLTPTDEILSTPTTVASFTPLPSQLPADAACSPGEKDQYLKAVLPLADAHTVDSYEAQKMDAIPEVPRVAALKQRAVLRLESIRGIQAPSCLLEVHEKMTGSFELLISTWDLIEAKDYPAAAATLKQSYEGLSEAVAIIALLE